MSFLLVVGFLIADISASIWFGKMVGGWMLLLWFVMAFFLGRQIMRGATKELMPRFKQAQQGQSLDPNTDFLVALCQALAGFLFIVPSILTDVLAVLLLLPPVQRALQGKMTQAFEKRGNNFMTMGAFGGMGKSPFGKQSPFAQQNPFGNGDVFEGEATEIEPEPKLKSTMRVTTAPEKPIQTTTEIKSSMKVTTRLDKK